MDGIEVVRFNTKMGAFDVAGKLETFKNYAKMRNRIITNYFVFSRKTKRETINHKIKLSWSIKPEKYLIQPKKKKT